MPLKKQYSIADTQAAIDRADYNNINKYKLVRKRCNQSRV